MKTFLDKIIGKKVLIIGDVMIDRYVTGNVRRISPEAPVPVLDWKKSEERLGGAANVALNIKALGATPYLLSVAGTDDDGHLLKALLKSESVDNQYITLISDRPTTVKTRMLAGGQQLLRLDKETTEDISNDEATALLATIQHILENEKIAVIIFQDYNKGLLTEKIIKQVVKLAREKKIPTATDPKKKHFLAYQGVSLFKPNLKEISEHLEISIPSTLKALKAATQVFRQKMNCEHLMVTLSEKGIFIDNSLISNILPTKFRNIADVCGAGDTVISVAALALATGSDLEEIAMLSNIAGGQVCEKIGVVPINRTQFLAEINSLS